MEFFVIGGVIVVGILVILFVLGYNPKPRTETIVTPKNIEAVREAPSRSVAKAAVASVVVAGVSPSRSEAERKKKEEDEEEARRRSSSTDGGIDPVIFFAMHSAPAPAKEPAPHIAPIETPEAPDNSHHSSHDSHSSHSDSGSSYDSGSSDSGSSSSD